jgi:hypothetical protein
MESFRRNFVSKSYGSGLTRDRRVVRLGQVDADEQMPSWQEYLWATGVMNSRRIWWNGQGHLVPLLDFVNCRTAGMSRAHTTQADVDGAAITHAAARFERGAEVFEDYAQPNHIYFLYHGFMLPDNRHDCVLLPSGEGERRAPCIGAAHRPLSAALRRRAAAHLASYATTLHADALLLASLLADDDRSARQTRLRDTIAFRVSEKQLLTLMLSDDEVAHNEL